MLNFLQESVETSNPRRHYDSLKPPEDFGSCLVHLWPAEITYDLFRKPRALLHRFIQSVVRSAAPSASSRARSLSAFSPWNEIRIEHTIFLNTVPLLISIKSLKSSIPPPRSLALALSLSQCVSLSLFTPCMLSCSLCWSLQPSCSVWGVAVYFHFFYCTFLQYILLGTC